MPTSPLYILFPSFVIYRSDVSEILSLQDDRFSPIYSFQNGSHKAAQMGQKKSANLRIPGLSHDLRASRDSAPKLGDATPVLSLSRAANCESGSPIFFSKTALTAIAFASRIAF